MSTAGEGSITAWLQRAQAGDPDAPAVLWAAYGRRVLALAQARLRGLPQTASDAEDLALSVFKSFFRGLQEQRFPQLSQRDDLWRLLFVITARKATAVRRHWGRARNPERHVVPLSDDSVLADVWGREPSPELTAELAEAVEQRLAALPTEELRQIAVWKLEGYTNREIAKRLQTYEVKIERKLRTIRSVWRTGDEQDSPGDTA